MSRGWARFLAYSLALATRRPAAAFHFAIGRSMCPARSSRRATAEGTGERPGKRAKATSRTRKAKAEREALKPPDDWRTVWEMIVELRNDRTAVVDSMGSEALADPTVDEATRQYQTLISLMLSSQTKDTVTAETMRALRDHGLTVENILENTSDAELNELIKKVGFHNNKTKFIREATKILRDDYGSRVPNTMDGLCALPGVGPKMALIVLRVAHGITAGVAVDTHVHRIVNQLGWVGPAPTKTPEKTRAALESWLPEDLWDSFNLILVGLGQEIQTEKPKLLAKCLGSSDPTLALRIVSLLGLDAEKVAMKHAADLQVRCGLDYDEVLARLS